MNHHAFDKGERKWCDHLADITSHPRFTLGPYATYTLQHDPKHLCFELARYKFCAKLLAGKKLVAEVGCGDAFGTPIVAQSVEHLQATDMMPEVIDDNRQRLQWLTNARFSCWDPCKEKMAQQFDAIYSLDVIEHIDPTDEAIFLENICNCIKKKGVLILGTPNKRADQYASEASRKCHVNLKEPDELRQLLHRFFHHVMIYSMNDEIVHTGFLPMAHYLIGVGIDRKTYDAS